MGNLIINLIIKKKEQFGLNPGRSSPDQMVSERLKTNFTHIQIEPAIFPISHKLIIFRELFGGFIFILKF